MPTPPYVHVVILQKANYILNSVIWLSYFKMAVLMDNKNALILGVIKHLIEYGDIPKEMSPGSLEAIFDNHGTNHNASATVNPSWGENFSFGSGAAVEQADMHPFDEPEILKMELESQKMMTRMLSEQIMQMESQLNQSLLPISLMGDSKVKIDPKHQDIFERICVTDEYLSKAFAEVGMARLSSLPKHSKLLCAERKMGTVLLGSINYKGEGNPPILMGLFAKHLISKLLQDDSMSNAKFANQANVFAQRVETVFEEAKQLNYDLAVCLIEPFWSKMYFYTNQIPLLYISGNRLMDLAKSGDVETRDNYKEVCVDYTKNTTFYLPTFNITDAEAGVDEFRNKLKTVLLKVNKAPIDAQKKEIENAFAGLEETEAKILAGDNVLIFRI